MSLKTAVLSAQAGVILPVRSLGRWESRLTGSRTVAGVTFGNEAAKPKQPSAVVRGQNQSAGGPVSLEAWAAFLWLPAGPHFWISEWRLPFPAGLQPISFFFSPSRQVYFKTPSGELQTVLLQEAPAVTVAPSSTSCSSPVSRNSGTASSSKKPTARKERPLPKIAPAGGVISLSAAQLAAAAQAMQTININGVQVQGVPVTITNAGGGLRAAPRRAGGTAGCRCGGQTAPSSSALCSWDVAAL